MANYAGMVMLLSFLVEILFLTAANRWCGYETRWGGTVLAAEIGGLYAGICLLPGFRVCASACWRYGVLLLMIWVAFGITKQAVFGGAAFLLMNLATDHLSPGFDAEQIWQLLLCAGLIILLRLNSWKGGKGTVPVEILHNGIRVRLTALRDTGNELQDPVTGKKVLIIGADAAHALTGLSQTQLRKPVDTVAAAAVPGLRLVPYHTIGKPAGFLLAMRMQSVRIANKDGSCLVAFAPDGLGKEMKYQALTGGII